MERIVKKRPSIKSMPKKKNVCAYARVSTTKDTMLNSLSAQVSYYSRMIQEHSEWNYVGVFVDGGITGTKANRPKFQEMIAKCKAGEIDLIITKSISRFARNTVTVLETTRLLKEIDVDVYFEEQKINTLSAEGELMLSLLASFAQEENYSASENMKWRIRKAFENGEIYCWSYQYGYIMKDGKVVINEEQAKIVKEIFQRVIDGQSYTSIAADLERRKVPTLFGGLWDEKRIRAMVKSEKYIGNVLSQKTYVNNHLEKKRIRNTGELSMFYAEGTHPAIIDKETFEKAQKRVKQIEEKAKNNKKATHSPFTSFIKCEKCGASYRRKWGQGHYFFLCATKYHHSSKACDQWRFPEPVVLEITSHIMGRKNYTKEELHNEVKSITANENTITYHFHNGKDRKFSYIKEKGKFIWQEELQDK